MRKLHPQVHVIPRFMRSAMLRLLRLRLLLVVLLLVGCALCERSPYEVLNLQNSATKEDVKKAYRKLALEWHPDKHPTNQEEATKRFQEISEAYETLSDPDLRAAFDQRSRFTGGTAGNPRTRAEEVHRRHRAWRSASEVFDEFFRTFGEFGDDYEKTFGHKFSNAHQQRHREAVREHFENAQRAFHGAGGGGEDRSQHLGTTTVIENGKKVTTHKYRDAKGNVISRQVVEPVATHGHHGASNARKGGGGDAAGGGKKKPRVSRSSTATFQHSAFETTSGPPKTTRQQRQHQQHHGHRHGHESNGGQPDKHTPLSETSMKMRHTRHADVHRGAEQQKEQERRQQHQQQREHERRQHQQQKQQQQKQRERERKPGGDGGHRGVDEL